jgi:hypothetical protein
MKSNCDGRNALHKLDFSIQLLPLTNGEHVASGIDCDPPEDIVIVAMKVESAPQQSRGVPRQEVPDVGLVGDFVLGDHPLHNKARFSGGQNDFNLHAPPPCYRATETHVSHASFNVLFHVDID